MKVCAYCDRSKPLTKEHIIPSFRYRKYPDSNLSFSENAGKWLHTEHQIKDVCADCNNGPLSELDAYAKKFVTENNLDNPVRSSASILIRYDYHLLLRFALKVFYNAQRMRNEVDPAYYQLRSFILNGSTHDLETSFKLFFEIRKCEELINLRREMETIPEEIEKIGYLPPKTTGIGRVLIYNTTVPELPTPRHLSFGNYRMYLLLFPSSIEKTQRKYILKQFNSSNISLTELRDKKSSVTVPVSNQRLIDWYQTDLRYKEQWEEYLSTNK